MKELFKPLTNWRVSVLALLSALAAVLILSEGDTPTLMSFLVKILGFALVPVIYLLGRHWNRQGKIDELTDLVNEEE